MEKEIISDHLVLDEPAIIDNSIQSCEFRNFMPPSQGNLNGENTIQMDIEAADAYYLPSKSHILISGRLVRADNNARYEAVDEIALINNAMMYLFKNIEYLIHDQSVESINYPGQVTSMLGYLKYPDDFNTSSGLKLCWSKDTTAHASSAKYVASPAQAAGAMDLGAVTPRENTRYNQGFAARKSLLMNHTPRGEFSFSIPFGHIFGFAEYDKILFNLKQSLIFRRQPDTEAIFRANGVADGRIILTKMIWRMPQITPSPERRMNLTKDAISGKTFPLSFSGRTVESSQIPANASEHFWSLSTKSGVEKPRWVILALQANRNATQEQNPAVFDHANLQSAVVSIGGINYPNAEIEANFTTGDYVERYEMFDSFKENYYGFDSLIGGNQVNFVAYKDLFPIVVFDVRRQSEQNKSGVLNIILTLKFRVPLVNAVSARAVIISDRMYKLKSDGTGLTPLSY